MDDDIARRVYSDPVARWFVTEAYRIVDTADLVAASGEQLVLSGIPLYRLAYFQLTLHPEFAGKGYFWRRGKGIEVANRAHGDNQDADYRDNPLPVVFEQQKTVRVRLQQIEPQAPILKQLKSEGATDYVALPLIFSTGHVDALSVVSDHPRGFSMTDLDRMFLLQFAFTRIVETHSLRDTAVNLLNAYVGRAAGERILAGEVRRGDGQTIEAVIWYCDLRGFTRASDALPRDAIIALLNDYFDAMGAIVTDAGGEILKFMGDGMLRRPCRNSAARRAGGRFGIRRHPGVEPGPGCGRRAHGALRARSSHRRSDVRQHRRQSAARLHGDRPGGEPRRAPGKTVWRAGPPGHPVVRRRLALAGWPIGAAWPPYAQGHRRTASRVRPALAGC